MQCDAVLQLIHENITWIILDHTILERQSKSLTTSNYQIGFKARRNIVSIVICCIHG